jgi:methionyl-tRNA synthetase
MSFLRIPRARMAFVSTPIFYPSGPPHLGHAYTMVLAAAVARVEKLLHPGQPHLLSTGTDEHGLKIQKCAA